jgi:hypothetical protein
VSSGRVIVHCDRRQNSAHWGTCLSSHFPVRVDPQLSRVLAITTGIISTVGRHISAELVVC